jgi:hypothetical protein
LLAGLDSFHLLGPDRAVFIVEQGAGFRAMLVDLERLPREGVALAVPNRVEEASDIRVAALLTADARFLERPTPEEVSAEAQPVDRALTANWKERPLSAELLARAVSSAWRGSMTPADLPVAQLQAAFHRFVAAFALWRIESLLPLMQAERSRWAAGAQLRADRIADLMTDAEGALPDAIADLEKVAKRLEWEANVPPSVIVADFEELIRVRRLLAEARQRLEVQRTQYLFAATIGEGAAGFITHEDLYDEVGARRSANASRLRVFARLDELKGRTERLAEVVRAALAPRRFDEAPDSLIAELLAVRAVVECAFAAGFGAPAAAGLDSSFDESAAQEAWARVEGDELLANLRATLLANLPPTDLDSLRTKLAMAGLAIPLAALAIPLVLGAAGLIVTSSLPQLAGTAIGWMITGYETWETIRHIELRTEVAFAIQGRTGYRDSDLERDILVTMVFAVFFGWVDALSVPKYWREFFGTPSVNKLISRTPGLRRMRRQLSEHARCGFDPAEAGLLADAMRSSGSVHVAEARDLIHGLSAGLAAGASDGRRAAIAEIDRRGGWARIVEALESTGVGADSLHTLVEARDNLVRSALVGHSAVRIEKNSHALDLLVSSSLGVAPARANLAAARQHLASTLGPAWEHQLGASAALRIDPSHKAEVAQHLLSLWRGAEPTAGLITPRMWGDGSPTEPALAASRRFIGQMAELGGWKAISRQIEGNIPAAEQLEGIRTELYEYISRRFGVRGGGTPSFRSDLDVSLMYFGSAGGAAIGVRRRELVAFMDHISGAAAGTRDLWRRAFDMGVFIDPSLATFWERMPSKAGAMVLAEHVLRRSGVLADLMQSTEGPALKGPQLLVEYARTHPFPRKYITAGIEGAESMTAAQLAEKLADHRVLAQMDAALDVEMDAALRGFDDAVRQRLSAQVQLERALTVSDVALAQALANSEAYFLAGGTKTVMIVRDGVKLYAGIATALTRIKRLYLEELRDTVHANWSGHVVEVVRPLLASDWRALDAATKTSQIRQASFVLGKYGSQRAIGMLLRPAARRGPRRAWISVSQELVQKMSKLDALGKRLKDLRDGAAPEAILDLLGGLTAAEADVLARSRALRSIHGDPRWPNPSLSAEELALFAPSGSLSPDRLLERAHEKLVGLVARLVGNSADLHNPTAGVIGELRAALQRSAEADLPQLEEWLLWRLGGNGAKLWIDGPTGADVEAESTVQPRSLGASPPDADHPLDCDDLDDLGIGCRWKSL